MQRVGFIGLGAMGLPMARQVMAAGFQLRVWARRPEAADALRDEGATVVASPAELSRSSDAVVLSVTNSPDVEDLVTREDGLLAGAAEGSVIADCSTIAPVVSRRMAEVCATRGVSFLDAPVSGGTQGARAGTLTIMVGGDPRGFEAARPVLEAMGHTIVHAGPSGAGEIIKLANNVLVGTIALATAEALVMGVKAGADLGAMTRVIAASTGASWQLENQFPLRAFNGSFQPGFMTDLLVKDLDLALDLAGSQHTPMFLTALARQMYGQAQARGSGREDYTSVLRLLESTGGVEVRMRDEDRRASP